MLTFEVRGEHVPHKDCVVYDLERCPCFRPCHHSRRLVLIRKEDKRDWGSGVSGRGRKQKNVDKVTVRWVCWLLARTPVHSCMSISNHLCLSFQNSGSRVDKHARCVWRIPSCDSCLENNLAEIWFSVLFLKGTDHHNITKHTQFICCSPSPRGRRPLSRSRPWRSRKGGRGGMVHLALFKQTACALDEYDSTRCRLPNRTSKYRCTRPSGIWCDCCGVWIRPYATP